MVINGDRSSTDELRGRTENRPSPAETFGAGEGTRTPDLPLTRTFGPVPLHDSGCRIVPLTCADAISSWSLVTADARTCAVNRDQSVINLGRAPGLCRWSPGAGRRVRDRTRHDRRDTPRSGRCDAPVLPCCRHHRAGAAGAHRQGTGGLDVGGRPVAATGPQQLCWGGANAGSRVATAASSRQRRVDAS
jgi:hypothetical protein